MNDQNLIPMSERTARERVELGRKGQKKSTETKRANRTMREMMKLLLDLKVKGQDENDTLDGLGIDDKDKNNRMLVAVGLFKRAVMGDPRAVEVLCGISGDTFTIKGEEEDETNAVEQIKELEVKFVDASQKGEKNGKEE